MILKARVFLALKTGISCTKEYLIDHARAESTPVEGKAHISEVQKMNMFTIYSHLPFRFLLSITLFYHSQGLILLSVSREGSNKSAGPSRSCFSCDSQGREHSVLLEKKPSGKMETTKKMASLPLTKKTSVAGLSS